MQVMHASGHRVGTRLRDCEGVIYSRSPRGSGGIGRRASLRSWWPKGRRGSSPFFRRFFTKSNGGIKSADARQIQRGPVRAKNRESVQRSPFYQIRKFTKGARSSQIDMGDQSRPLLNQK